MNPTCSTCRFFRPDDYANDACKRHAPVAIFDGRSLSSVWPLVKADQGCGDHEPVAECASIPSPVVAEPARDPFPADSGEYPIP